MVPRCLTIAGSDSGGGAGIQADLKTFAALGVYGTSAITALTAQNTERVVRVFGIPPGVMAGMYLAEFGESRFGKLVRFSADVMSGVPSITVGMAV